MGRYCAERDKADHVPIGQSSGYLDSELERESEFALADDREKDARYAHGWMEHSRCFLLKVRLRNCGDT